MSKNKRMQYTAERKEHYRMYKDGKRFVFAMVSALSFTTGVFLMSGHTVSADSNDSAETSSAVTTGDKASASTDTTSDTDTTSTTTAQATTSATTATADSSATTSATTATAASTTAQASTDTSTQQENATTDTTDASKTTAETATAVKSVTDSSSDVASTADQSAATTVTTQTAPAPTATNTTTLVNPTDEELTATKTKQAAVYATTGQAQQVNAVAAASSVQVTQSATKVGYQSGLSTYQITVKYSSPKAGDVVAITIPGDSPVLSYQNYQAITTGVATTDLTSNDDDTRTLTNTFLTDYTGVITQIITYNLFNNGRGFDAGTVQGGTTTKTVSYSVDGVAQNPLTFTQVISPKAAPTTPTRYYPTTSTVSAILPNTEYVYSYKVNESDGVLDDTYPSTMVNSATNYGGATVTLPVPTGFLLDTTNTAAINAFKDGTTITQPGGVGTDIIISAPAKAGSQGYQGGPGYLLAGSFVVTQTDTNQTLTASGVSTFTQTVNAAGDTVTATGNKPWTETILAATTAVTNTLTVSAAGNSSSAPTSLLLDNDTTNDPDTLGSFSFSSNSAAALSDAHINITIPNGLDVTSFSLPTATVSSTAYLPGTTSYKYELTMSDGSTQEGTADAGSTVTRTGTAAIRQIVLTPNTLAPGATTGANAPTNPSLGIKVMGTLSSTYDDGTAVQVGDQLVESITITVGDDAKVLNSSSVTQTVTVPTARVTSYNSQSSTTPGATNAGNLALQGAGSAGQTTNYVYEPIFYYVLPTATSFNGVAKTGGAIISQFTEDDGRTVVKIDYTGTGEYAEISTFQDQVFLNNLPDALPGSYTYFMYVVSPTTALMNTGKPTDLSYVEGNTNAFTMFTGQGIGNWKIDPAGVFINYSFAQGNQDTTGVTKGTADISGDATVVLSTAIVNTSSATTAGDATEVINLPTIGDSIGSQVTFQLTGPIELPANYTTATGVGTTINGTVLYSTELAVLSSSDTTADTAGYVSANAVTDWSSIRSIIIELTGVPTNTTTGRIAMTGTIENFREMANNTGYVQTAMFAGSTASIQTQNTTPTAASITVVGTATVGARFHYVDLNGDDQYIDLPDLSQSVAVNSGILNNIYPTSLAGFSAADLALIPAGYGLVTNADGTISYTVVDANGDGTAVIGETARYYFDGDQIQYELVGKKLNLEYVDDNNGGAQVGATKTYEGNASDTVNWTTTIPTGYALASGQAASGSYTLGDEAVTTMQVHLVHVKTQSTATNTFSAQVVDQAGNTLGSSTGTTTYVWSTDAITGAEETVSSDMPSISVKIPTGYSFQSLTLKANGTETTLDRTSLAFYEDAGFITISGSTYSLNMEALIGEGGATVAAIKKAINELNGTQMIVNVTADSQSTTITFLDADDGDNPIGSPITVAGVTGGTSTYEVGDQIPAGYYYTTNLKDASGTAITNPSLTGSIPFTSDGADGLTIYLKHKLTVGTKTSSRTITYVINNHDGTPASDQSQAPATVTQTIVWKTITDQVTGTSYATPQGVYTAVNSLPIAGYTVDQPTVAQLAENGAATSAVKDATPVVVHYSPNQQTTTLRFVDLDEGGTQIGESQTITGYTDASTAYNVSGQLPTGYYYPANVGTDADGNRITNTPLSGEVAFTSDGATVVTIYLKHILTESTATTTRTITYQINDAPNHVATDQSKAPAPVVQTITWKVVKDEVTGTSYATAQEAYAAVTSPTIPGYTVDTTVVPVLAQGSVATDNLANAENVLVQYTADAHSMTVTVVDADDGNRVLNSETLDGYTDSTVSYDFTLKPGYFHPATYGGETNAPLTKTITFGPTGAANVTIYLQHIITNSTMTTTRTINYEIDTADGSRATDQSKAPAQAVQTITWQIVTDKVTGTSFATAKDAYAALTSPTVAGYTPDQPTVAVLAQGSLPTTDVKNAADVLVKYAPKTQDTTIVFLDLDDHNTQVGEVIPVSGYTDESTNYNVANKIPTNYYYPADTAEDTPNTSLIGEVSFTSDGAPVVQIYVKHIITNSTTTTTRTINYQIDNGDGSRATEQGKAPRPVVQEITWKIVTDKVTGTSVATAQQAYAAVTSPTIAGYTVDPATVALLPQGSVTAANVKDAADVLVQYTPVANSVTVQVIDADEGDRVLNEVTLNGFTDSQVYYTFSTPTNYYYPATYGTDADNQPVPNAPLAQTITFGSTPTAPITIYLKHKLTNSTMTTTRTITYQINDVTGHASTNQSKAPTPVAQTITWNVVKDNVTGTSYATAQDAYAAVTSDSIPGYTVSDAVVPVLAQGSLVTGDVKNAPTVTVVYTPQPQATTVTLVDADGGYQVLSSTAVPGVTDETVGYDVRGQVPVNYYVPTTAKDEAGHTVTNPALKADIAFTSAGADGITIYLKHVLTSSTMTTTRTINYQIDDASGALSDDQSKAPAPVVQQITWNVITDNVTKSSYATAQQAYAAVKSPAIAGYTVEPETAAVLPQGSVKTSDVKNAAPVTVVYTPSGQTTQVRVVDFDEDGKVLASTDVNGATDATVPYDVSGDVPTGYTYPATVTDATGETITNPALKGSISFASDGAAIVTIYLKHIITNTTMTTTRTINYQLNDATGQAATDQSKAPTQVVQPITWKVVTDEVTGTSYATAQQAYAAVTSQLVAGYTVDTAVVPVLAQGNLATSDVKNAAPVTVVYTPIAQGTTVVVVDADDGDRVLSRTDVAGVTDETVGYDVSGKVPAHYEVPTTVKTAAGTMITNPALKGEITFTSDGAPVVTIYLKHVITNSTMTTTRTINYQINNASGQATTDQSKAPAQVVQPISWQVVTDEVTGTSYATAQQAYAAVKSPAVAGYQVSAATVPVLAQGSVATDQVQNATDVLVTYTPLAQTTRVILVDADEANRVIGTTDVAGVTDQTVSYDVSGKVPAHYEVPRTLTDAAGNLITNPALAGDITFTSNGADPITIYLKHVITNSTMTTTRTINYQIDNGDGTVAASQSKAPTQVVQTINWQVVTDEVTGTSYATAQQAYTAVKSPAIAGYTADPSAVAVLAQGSIATSAVQNAADVLVQYHPDKQATTVSFVDADNNDAPIGTVTTVDGYTDGTTGYDVSGKIPAGYYYPATYDTVAEPDLTSKTTTGGSVNAPLQGVIAFTSNGAAGIVIHLKHLLADSTVTTTRTIHAVAGTGVDASALPADIVQTVTWQVVTDEATGQVLATPQGGYAAQTLRPFSLGAGQTLVPSQYSVAAETPQPATTLAGLTNSTVNVTYRLAQLPDNGDTTAYQVIFMDATGHVVGTTTLTGQTGQVFTLTAPSGYQYAKNVSGTVTLNGDSSQTIELLVVKTGGETNPSNPTNPTNPTKPTKPDNGGHGGQNGGNNGGSTDKGSSEVGHGNGSVVNAATGTPEQKPSTNALLDQHRQLPQTGDAQNNTLSVIGLSLMGMLAMLGTGAKKRKKDDE